MLCEEYSKLNPVERIEFIGKLIHAAQNDTVSFNCAGVIISTAEKRGLFDKVKILPLNEEGNSNTSVSNTNTDGPY